MRSPVARLSAVLALALFAACSDATAPTPPVLYPLGPNSWQLASVNGKAVSMFSTAQAYSFHANAGDRYNTRVIAVDGEACTSADGRFLLQRELWAFVDTGTSAPYLPAAAPFGGELRATGAAIAIGANAWRFADTVTATRSRDTLTVTFTREGPAIYVFVDAGAIGRQTCALAGYQPSRVSP